jgi:hypothetical protein
MSNDTASLQAFLTKFNEYNYSIGDIYNENRVKYILLLTPLQRKPFLLEFPEIINIQTNRFDLTLEEEKELNYKSFRQREYLLNLELNNIACITEENMTIKINNLVSVYRFKESNEKHEVDSSDEDIDIHEYKVSSVYPVFSVVVFMKEIASFEKKVVEIYTLLTETEEKYNEQQVIGVIEKFENQKKTFKDLIFDIHKKAYNIRRDIVKTSEQLEKMYELRKKSVNEKDRIRFKLERLISETETKLDQFNDQLSQYRNMGDCVLKKYNDYISKIVW